VKYTFIDQHLSEFRVVSMCRALKVHRSGYYAWKAEPLSARAIEDAKLLVEIKQSYEDSQGIYGSPRVHRDLREAGFKCSEKRVARLMCQAKLKSQRGYRRPRYKSGKPAIASPNHLQQQFEVSRPDEVWVTDITQIRTYEGWLYVAVVVDLYSRAVGSWSGTRCDADGQVAKTTAEACDDHSDQGSQFGSDEFSRWCKENNLVTSMSRRGNCYDNAVAESFFSNLKKEKIKNRIYNKREEAKSDVFEYIEMFYNRKCRHGYLNQMSPMAFEALQIGSN